MLCGYGKIMQLILHIIGRLEYGNFFSFNAIRLLLADFDDFAANFVFRVAIQFHGSSCIRVNTRLFVSANRLSILYMVIKLRSECEKSISVVKGHTLFVFLSVLNTVFMPDQTTNN